jgi:Tol biopolymer transport system component
MSRPALAAALVLLAASCGTTPEETSSAPDGAAEGRPAPLAPAAHGPDAAATPPEPTPFAGSGWKRVPDDPREKRLRNLRMLTFEGENAEAYWSSDGTRLVFQHRGVGVPADQIYEMRADGTGLRRVSDGTGKTTCSFFLPGDRSVLYASTHAASPAPPPPPDRSRGYVWPIHAEYDLFAKDLDGGAPRRLTDTPGYDAEAVVAPDGSRIVFTSVRDGDLDLYTMALDGSDVRRVTTALGYDGGAFFSPDSKRLVYRAYHPKTPEAEKEYRELLAMALIRPVALQIFTSAVDGSDRVQVTDNGKANFAPFFHPDGKRIVFSSNLDDPKGRSFDLYLVNADGTGLERVTYAPEFDGFPMFSPDGKTLVFCSNRHGPHEGSTNVFLADWVE